VLLPDADLELLERASQRVFDRFWGKSTAQLKEMHAKEAREFMREFEDLLYEMPFQAPDNLIMLGRCVSILSGICTGLDPEFNIFENVTPYAGKLIEAEGGDRWSIIWNEVVRIGQLIIKLPARADNMLTRLEQGRLEVRVPALSREIDRLKRSQGKTTTAIIFAAFLLSGVQFYLAGELVLSIISWGIASVLLVWMILQR
jgi:predicted unusual protein kinase regulating ubiquinone biosynthesis (AarF/ABC1/UbiB family)